MVPMPHANGPRGQNEAASGSPPIARSPPCDTGRSTGGRQPASCNLNPRGRRSQRSSNRLGPSDGRGCRKEHRKKVRLIRPRQSQTEQGDQRNYSELPYFGVQSVLSPLPSPHDTFEQERSWWRKTCVL